MTNNNYEERNKEICQCYINGMTLSECGKKFNLSSERVRQVLRLAGVLKDSRAKQQTDRDEFLGINISETDKVALREEAARRGLSMSRLSSDFIKEMLTGLHRSEEL